MFGEKGQLFKVGTVQSWRSRLFTNDTYLEVRRRFVSFGLLSSFVFVCEFKPQSFDLLSVCFDEIPTLGGCPFSPNITVA